MASQREQHEIKRQLTRVAGTGIGAAEKRLYKNQQQGETRKEAFTRELRDAYRNNRASANKVEKSGTRMGQAASREGVKELKRQERRRTSYPVSNAEMDHYGSWDRALDARAVAASGGTARVMKNRSEDMADTIWPANALRRNIDAGTRETGYKATEIKEQNDRAAADQKRRDEENRAHHAERDRRLRAIRNEQTLRAASDPIGNAYQRMTAQNNNRISKNRNNKK